VNAALKHKIGGQQRGQCPRRGEEMAGGTARGVQRDSRLHQIASWEIWMPREDSNLN
jgi:hypothetical protein